MKFYGFRVVETFDGVEIAARDAADVDFEFLKSTDAVSLAPFSHPPCLIDPQKADRCEPSATPIRYRLRRGEKDEVAQVEGCLIIGSVSALVDFYEHHYVPSGECGIDRMVRKLQAGERGSRRRLESFLDFYMDLDYTVRMMRHQGPLQFDKMDLKAVVLGEKGEAHCRWFFERREKEEPLMIARETSRTIGGHRIPRLAFLVTHHQAFMQPDPTELNFLLFDGEAHRWYRRLDDLNHRDLERLEAEGTVYETCLFDPLPQTHLQARALIRVPRRDEAEARRNVRRLRRPRHDVLRQPGILRDSRQPIALPRNLPVIDSAAVGMYVLAHNINGIYLPEDALAQVNPDALPEEDAWMVLCAPAVPL